MDYLTEEVLARQTEDVVSFLLETSVLERLCGPRATPSPAGPMGRRRSNDWTRRALPDPLDEERRWWRYHRLFADLLRVRLQHERGERAPDLHRAAAAWHEEHGFPDEAVRHAAAGDVAWAARLIELNVEGLLRRSEGNPRRLAIHPACGNLRTRPRLGLARAVKAAVESDPGSSTCCWQMPRARSQPSVTSRISHRSNGA